MDHLTHNLTALAQWAWVIVYLYWPLLLMVIGTAVLIWKNFTRFCEVETLKRRVAQLEQKNA